MNSSSLVLVLAVSSGLLAGCGDSGDASTDQTAPSGNAGAGGAAASGGAGSGAGGDTGGRGGAGQGGMAPAGGGQAGGGQAGAGPTPQPCDPQTPCAPIGTFGSYCVYADQMCGKGFPTGHCQQKAFDCPVGFPYVCGCDGVASACLPASGVDESILGGCPAPAGYFACGALFCKQTESCVHHLSDVSTTPDAYECAPLPAGCDPAKCSCAKPACGGASCDDSGGGVTITCPGA